MDILIGIFLIVFGMSIAFFGIQVFFAILPILGFVTGFFTGAAGVEAIFGDGFLSTVTGWIVGLVVGLLFAAIAWFWWYVGVLLSAGAAGSLLATAIAEAVGIDSGWVLFLFGVVGAAVFIFVSLLVNLPIYVVIANTAIAGASIFISGLMLIFNQVDTEELEEGLAVATVEASWWWVLAWAAVAAIGIGRQLALKDSVRLPSERWEPAGATAI
jgi:hypothetical protein